MNLVVLFLFISFLFVPLELFVVGVFEFGAAEPIYSYFPVVFVKSFIIYAAFEKIHAEISKSCNDTEVEAESESLCFQQNEKPYPLKYTKNKQAYKHLIMPLVSKQLIFIGA